MTCSPQTIPYLSSQHALWREFGFGPEILARAQSEMGDVIRLPLTGMDWFLISHPDDVERVLKESHQRFDKGAS